jgi:hypothetical protein
MTSFTLLVFGCSLMWLRYFSQEFTGASPFADPVQRPRYYDVQDTDPTNDITDPPVRS